jgi:hypothetical protein
VDSVVEHLEVKTGIRRAIRSIVRLSPNRRSYKTSLQFEALRSGSGQIANFSSDSFADS